ncbi:MAG: LEA type 2 family protein [Gammaproteobacteria bacterium]|nr:LEA type 2 family protein [Gammaproteobacteria bacterium]
MLRILYYLSLILSLTACAGLETKPAQFKINISSMQVLESTLMEQRYQISLRIMNRSNEALDVNGMSFDVELNDRDFASGVSNASFTLAPLSEKVVDVTVTSTIFGLIRQVNAMKELKSKPFNYELSGHIYSSNNLFGIPFEEKGEVNLKAKNRQKTLL